MRDLIRAGALDGCRASRRELLWALGELRYEEEALLEPPPTEVELPVLGAREALSWDYELLGLSPEDHSLRPRLRAQHILSAAELGDTSPGKVVRVAGLAIVRQAPPTAHGHLFTFGPPVFSPALRGGLNKICIYQRVNMYFLGNYSGGYTG